MKLCAIAVDDEAASLKRFSRLAGELEGLELTGTFTDPSEAIEAVRSTSVDLVFLDIEMPQVNGLDLAEKLIEIKPSLDVIFITAYDKYALAAFQVYAIGYLLKPVDIADLRTHVERLLKRRNSNQANLNQPEESTQLKVSYTCFGRFQCKVIAKNQVNPAVLRFRTAKAEELVALLLYYKGAIVSKDKIIDRLWPDMDPEKAASNLYPTVFYVRNLIRENGIEDVIIRQRDGYAIRSELFINEDQKLIDYLSKHLGGPLRIRDKFTQIDGETLSELSLLKSYQGGYFAEQYFPWAINDAQRFEMAFEENAHILISNLIAIGSPELAIGLIWHAIKILPDCEWAYSVLLDLAKNSNDLKAINFCEDRLAEIGK